MNKKELIGEKLKYFGPVSRIAVIYFIGFSLFLLISTVMLIILTKPEREVVIPDVEGKQFIEVYNSLIRNGVQPEIKFKDIADLDDGVIINQHPKKGTVVPESRKLKLLVSRSRYSLDVPNLIGKELPLALNNLKNIYRSGKRISIGTGVVSYIPSDKIADNIVMDQSPRPGEKITPENKVNLLVSTGKLAVDSNMPDVVGQSIELCFDLIRAKGLLLSEEIISTDDKNKSGLIAAQTPQKGTAVQKEGAGAVKVYWYPLDKHPYSAYEKVEFQIPADEKAGLYEAYIEDSHSKRIRYSQRSGPGKKMIFVFRRMGDAKIFFLRNKKRIDETSIDVD
jgi:eukaryotic-like serine/threonine-protein kinase